MTTRKQQLVGVTALVAVAIVIGYVAYDFWRGQHTKSTDILLYGNVDIREADLAFNISGRVDKMIVEEGDTIERGQLLATLENDIYDAEVEAARERVGARRAVLDRLLAGSRPEEVREARANVRGIEADLEDARANLIRTEKLAKDDFATLKKLEDDRAQVKNLEARLKAVQQELSLAIQGPRDEDIAEARAQMRAEEAELALADRRLDYTKLLAKAPGVVNTRIVEPGAVVQPYAPVYSIALTDRVWVRTYVSEPDLGRIHPGMAAQVSTDSHPDKVYEGWIGFISPVAEFTPKTVETREVRTALVYRLRVYVKNPNNGLRQGMPVTVRLKPGTSEEQLGKAMLR
jgi:multidrug resistance efflux pump